MYPVEVSTGKVRPLAVQFDSARGFLGSLFQYHKLKNENYSVRAWSRSLGYRTPSCLNETLNGNRPVSIDLVHRVSKQHKLDPTEKRFLEVMTLRDNAESLEKPVFNDLLESIRPDLNVINFKVDQFKMIAEWYHMVILEMVHLPNFKSDPQEIANRLGSGVTATQVSDAIDRLIRLKLLKCSKSGKIERVDGLINFSSDLPNAAIQEHHRQMLEKSILALTHHQRDERHFSGVVIAMKRSDLPKVEKLIFDFHKRVSEALKPSAGHDPDIVCRLGSQFFRVIDAD